MTMLSNLIGFACGATTFSFLCWRIHRRMCLRILRHREMEELAQALERRRDAHDFRRDLTPPGAGPVGQESNLFQVRPGRMFLNHLDRQQNRTTLDHVSGSKDQT